MLVDGVTDIPAQRDRQRPSSALGRWYTLILLTAIFSVHHIDRNVLSVVVEPVKREFQLSDGAMGTLTGFAHALTLSLFVLPMGWLADRVNRVRLLSILVITWSALTGFGALAGSYASLLLMRIGVGAAEAGGSPTSVSIIADIFPRRQYPTAMGIYYFSAAIGTGVIFILGGYLAHAYGWRTLFLLAALPGILLGLLLWFTVQEPTRAMAHTSQAKRSITADVRELLRNAAAMRIIAAASIAAFAQNAIWVWMGSFLMRIHAMTIVQAGLVVGLSVAFGKGLGSLVAGPTSRYMAGDEPRKLWRYSTLALAASVPVGWMMVTTPSATVAIALTMVLAVLLGGWAGQGTAILVIAADERSRATAIAGWQFAGNFVGAALGPLFTGMLSDALGGEEALATAIGITLSMNLVSALGFWFACRRLSSPSPGCPSARA
jgi:predicted MFS family arabinose efflux permease